MSYLNQKTVKDLVKFDGVGLHSGKKVKVWKANFDGELDLKIDDVKESIDWYVK